MAKVLHKDGLYNSALHLLHHIPKQGAFMIKSCRASITALLEESICNERFTYKGRKKNLAELVRNIREGRVDGGKVLGPATPAVVLKRLTPLRLRQGKCSERLTFEELRTMKDPPNVIYEFQLTAIKLWNALTLARRLYRNCMGGTGTAGADTIDCGEKPSLKKVVVGSWNMRASYFQSTTNPQFLISKLRNLASVAQEHSMVLIALQECPGLANRSNGRIRCLISEVEFFSAWEYCEAQTGREAAGFLFDPMVLRLITPPRVFASNMTHEASKCSHAFVRPPVLAIFAAAGQPYGGNAVAADSVAQRLGLLVVCNIHLKCSEGSRPDLPRADVDLLGSDLVQGWIEQHIKDAKAAAGRRDDTNCVLLIGDFNLAARYGGSNADRSTHAHESLPDHVRATYAGPAWEGLQSCGYTHLLQASDTTNFGPPVTQTSCAYDNALVRYSVVGSSSAVGLDAVPKASVCDIAAKEIADMSIIRKMAAPDAERSDEWSKAVARAANAMLLELQESLFTSWSDHKPMSVHL